ncbi:MAG: decarboxylase, partial [Candidatus Aenigmarchaeota archaeon]|nr:decarboxylase [Candidatus Aenigmarchaeota archaeon]
MLSKGIVLEQYSVVEGLADMVSYSSKTNQEVTGVLEGNTDCMFSVHFANELVYVKDMSRVWFLAQAWDKDHVLGLLGRGVRSFVVDNESDLDVFLECMKDSDISVNLLLRVRLREMSVKSEKYFVFGMGSDVVNKRIRSLRSGFRGKLGVHFHRKTQNMSEWRLKYEVSEMLDEDVLSMIDFVNIGGGLPSKYANTNDDVLPVIFERIKELREWLNGMGVKMIIEPGRFIAAPAVRLVTKVIGVYDNTIVVDASVYNTDMDALIVPV